MAGFDNDTMFAQVGADVGVFPNTSSSDNSTEFSRSGGVVSLIVNNTSNTADSSASIISQIAGPNALSPYFGVALDGADSWSIGIDTDRRSRLFFTYNDTGDATPTNATNLAFRIEADSTITGASTTTAVTTLGVASEGTAIGGRVLLHCQNAESAVDSDAEILIETGDPSVGAGGGSGSIRWGSPDQNQYALGMSKDVGPTNQPLELLDGGFDTAAVPIIQFNGGAGGIIICNKTGAFQVQNGTTAERPSPASTGMIRYNTSTNLFEGFENGTWQPFITGTNQLFTWTEVTGTSQAGEVNTGYITNNGALVTVTLPTTAALGDVIRIAGKGGGGWRIAQNTNQTIHFGTLDTTVGVTGMLDSTDDRDCIELICEASNTDFVVISTIGNITVT